MMSTAVALAAMVSASMYFCYQKLPRNVRKFILKHSLFVDFLAMVVTFFLLGGTLTALIAGAIVDLMVSLMLHIANHPEDYEFLFDAMKAVKELINTAKDKLKQANESYKAKKAVPVLEAAEAV